MSKSRSTSPELRDTSKDVELKSTTTEMIYDESFWMKVANTPHVYHLIDSRIPSFEAKAQTTLHFNVFGCQGSGSKGQKDVAGLMKKAKAAFSIGLGDNFYDHGIDSVDDQGFRSRFEDMYSKPDDRIFLIPGNHDYNICRTGTTNGNFSPKKILPQITYTYMKDKKIFPGLVEKFSEKVLDLANLSKWNMPSRFYLLKPAANVNLFCLDSNTILNDYYEYELGKKSENLNQIEWLLDVYRQFPDAANLVFKHNSGHTIGKRQIDSDASHYLKPDVLTWMEERFKGNYNDMIRQVFNKLQLRFIADFAAHDHMQYYYVNDELTQVVAGGGGGDLQDRVEYKQAENVPFCESGHHGDVGFGYVDVTMDLRDPKNTIVIGFNNLQGGRFQFSPGSVVAHKQGKVDADTLFLCNKVIAACNEAMNISASAVKVVPTKYYGDYVKSMLESYITIPSVSSWITVPPKLKMLGTIKNYFNEFKKKTYSEYMDFLKLNMSYELMNALDAQFAETAYGSFKKFEERMSVPRSDAMAIPARSESKALPREKRAGISCSPDFRGAFFPGSPTLFSRTVQSAMDGGFDVTEMEEALSADLTDSAHTYESGFGSQESSDTSPLLPSYHESMKEESPPSYSDVVKRSIASIRI